MRPKKLVKNIVRNIVKSNKRLKAQEKLLKDFNADLIKYNEMAKADKRSLASKENLFPCLNDKTTVTEINPTYFYQDSWAFERIVKNKPKKHYDIGSQHMFVAFASKITELTMIDIRPLSLPMDTIKFIEGNILNLPFDNESIYSLSSLCVIEHIGLGRYGDPIDPKGSEKALNEIFRVLAPGARFYLSVPVSNIHTVKFNAGVIFNYEHFISDILQKYSIANQMFVANKSLTDKFTPDNNFGTTALLELIKK